MREKLARYAEYLDFSLGYLRGVIKFGAPYKRYIEFVRKRKSLAKAAILYNTLASTRVELYEIKLFSNFGTIDKSSYDWLKITQELDSDVKAYNNFAKKYFTLKECPE